MYEWPAAHVSFKSITENYDSAPVTELEVTGIPVCLNKISNEFKKVTDAINEVTISADLSASELNKLATSLNSHMSNTISTYTSTPCYSYDYTTTSTTTPYCNPEEDKIINKNIIKDKGKENMNVNLFNKFKFGPVSKNLVHMSMYGLAVLNRENNWVSYNKATGEIIDVDIFNCDGKDIFYMIPVPLKDVAAGDVVVHMGVPMIVTSTSHEEDDKEPLDDLIVVDPMAGERKIIVPTKSMFGFNFVTKIVSIMDMCGGCLSASENAPFGNMLPFLLMNNNSTDGGIDPLLIMMLSSQGNAQVNPLMWLAFSDKDKSDWLLPFLLMNQNGFSFTPNLSNKTEG